MSWRRHSRSLFALAAAELGKKEGPVSPNRSKRYRQMVSLSGSVISSETSSGILPSGFRARYSSDLRQGVHVNGPIGHDLADRMVQKPA